MRRRVRLQSPSVEFGDDLRQSLAQRDVAYNLSGESCAEIATPGTSDASAYVLAEGSVSSTRS